MPRANQETKRAREDSLSLGQLEQAAEFFEAGLCLMPGSKICLSNLGTVRTRQGRFDEALALHEAALPQDEWRHYEWALVGIAEVHVVRGDFSEAMVWLRRAVLDRNFALADVAREELFVDLQEHPGYRELVSEYVGDG